MNRLISYKKQLTILSLIISTMIVIGLLTITVQWINYLLAALFLLTIYLQTTTKTKLNNQGPITGYKKTLPPRDLNNLDYKRRWQN